MVLGCIERRTRTRGMWESPSSSHDLTAAGRSQHCITHNSSPCHASLSPSYCEKAQLEYHITPEVQCHTELLPCHFPLLRSRGVTPFLHSTNFEVLRSRPHIRGPIPKQQYSRFLGLVTKWWWGRGSPPFTMIQCVHSGTSPSSDSEL